MKKALRYTKWALGAILALLILVWVIAGAYVLLNKPALLKKARAELQKRTGGDVTIGDIDVSFFRHFPNITLYLKGVDLRDSAWNQHHHDLLKADEIFVRFSFPSLFSGHPRVNKVFLRQGSVYLFTDTSGYSNLSGLLRNLPQKDSGEKKKTAQPPDIALSNMEIVVDNLQQKKLFDLQTRVFDCSFEKDDRSLFGQISTDLVVKSFAFSTEKGSYMKDKRLIADFRLRYNLASHIVQGDKLGFVIGGQTFIISARFFPDVSPDPFSVTIQTNGIRYRDATALLTPALHEKLDQYDISKPVTLNALIDAGAADDPQPLINVRLLLDQGTVHTPVGDFTEASFTGTFSNEWIHGHKREDPNSILRFFPFQAKYAGIPLHSDTVTITNLHRPILSCHLQSGLQLTSLNELAGSSSIRFAKGSGKLDVNVRGPLNGDDSTMTAINGTLDLDTASLTYLPYNFPLNHCTGRLRFKDQDFLIDHLEAQTGKSKVIVKGAAKNLGSLISQSPDKISIDLNVQSPRIDLEDFTGLAGDAEQAGPSKDKSAKAPFAALSGRIDRMFRQCTINLLWDADNLSYQHFSGAHLKAALGFSNNEIRLSKMQLDQAIGSLTLNGKIRRTEGKAGNPLTLQSHLEQVDISKLFSSFDNFGQQAIAAKNLKGRLTADMQLSGLLTNKAKIVQHSLSGTIYFTLNKGELIDFPPMMKINEYIFKNRDLSDIYFAELKNQLDLRGSSIDIHRMEIASSAFTLYVEGVYDWQKGPDLSLQVPLSNLKKRKQYTPPPRDGNQNKPGLSVFLRAKNGDDGQLKISWDPFKKALKKNR